LQGVEGIVDYFHLQLFVERFTQRMAEGEFYRQRPGNFNFAGDKGEQ
jgi:hypothetical protein